MTIRVSQITIGRFHHFHLARQLEKNGYLKAIHTGYPRFQLRDESGIPRTKIRSFPWLQAPFMARGRFGLDQPWLSQQWAWLANETLDAHVSRRLEDSNVLIALSGSGLRSGRAIRHHGGKFICDRGSSHIRYQEDLLREEYRRWGLRFTGIDPRVIFKEESEYELADRITVPSEFVRRSFLERGIPASKLAKVSYGARLDRFSPRGEPHPEKFTVLFVGQVSLRKGFIYLLEAFEKLRHPGKELIVIGSVAEDVRPLLNGRSLQGVTFLGPVPNVKLSDYYSRAHVFVQPSIEEGLSMVMGEAMACGCPVIATNHTGAEDLLTDRQEGFIVPIRDPVAILSSLESLTQNPVQRDHMSALALKRVAQIGGWTEYGDGISAVLRSLFEGEIPS